jgi:hypothetical protein
MNLRDAGLRRRLGYALLALGAAVIVVRSAYVRLDHPGAFAVAVPIGAAIVGIGFLLLWTLRGPR